MTAASRFIILGTAGHIDHGKTALVGLLTGTDTDRLKEEKARGISIDLGFAHLGLPGGISCGVVDVPGHERFVKNMLAGACGVDAMLLVIAADEGVMPQTREHLDILDLLGVKRGVVALTKTDMVDEEWLELVTESVREYLDKRGFGGFSLVPVSSKTGEGRDGVLAALVTAVSDLEERPASSAVRLPVDRAFVMEGFGTVVTGTLWQGHLCPGDRLVLEPGGKEARARNVQVHGDKVEESRAGQRVAVALSGLSKDEVPRGTWLLSPGLLEPSHMLDVRLRVLSDAPKELRQRQRVRFHLGASEILGRVSLLEGDRIAPGKDALVQIRLEAPAVADRGDRFVVRSYSPARAIAGGKVILPVAPKRRRGSKSTLEELRREESGSPEDRLVAALEALPAGGGREDLARRSGLAPASFEAALAASLTSERARELEDETLIAAKALAALKGRAEELLAGFQEANAFRWGTSRGELKSRLGRKIPAALFGQVLVELETEGRVSQRGDHVRLGGAEIRLAPELEARVTQVAQALEDGGPTPPSAKELQAQLGFPATEVLEHLTFEGVAVKVTPELYLSHKHFRKLTTWLESYFQTHADLEVATLRTAWGMSRKYSVPVLEFLDREGWTRREGDVRVPGRRMTG
jgi:selenocysteine-specific elongation factor